jgi:hypothetical protein
MDGFIEPPLTPSLGSLPITRILFDVWDHLGVEDHLAIGRGIKAAIKVGIGASTVRIGLLGPIFDERLPERSIIEQCGKGSVDGGVVYC